MNPEKQPPSSKSEDDAPAPKPRHKSFINRLFSTRSPKNNAAAPPPYYSSSTSKSSTTTTTTPAIPQHHLGPLVATDVPQWLWTKPQCQNWIAAALIQFLAYDPAVADQAADKFDGFGPTIYSWQITDWQRIVPEKEKSAGVVALYHLVVSLRRREGAVPVGMVITHGLTEESKRIAGVKK